MSETTKGADLAVPDEARKAYDEVMIDLQLVAKGVRAPSRTQYGNIRAIAAPIVAAELRVQADRIATHSASLAQMYAHRLRVRADQVETANCCAPETRQPPLSSGADVRPEGPCDINDVEVTR